MFSLQFIIMAQCAKNVCLLITRRLLKASLWSEFSSLDDLSHPSHDLRPIPNNERKVCSLAALASRYSTGLFAKKLPKGTTAFAGFDGINHFQSFGIDHRYGIIKPVSHIHMPVIGMRVNPFRLIAHFNQPDFL
jgi:hypothetical protein